MMRTIFKQWSPVLMGLMLAFALAACGDDGGGGGDGNSANNAANAGNAGNAGNNAANAGNNGANNANNQGNNGANNAANNGQNNQGNNANNGANNAGNNDQNNTGNNGGNNGSNNGGNNANNDPPGDPCEFMPTGDYTPAENDTCNLIEQDCAEEEGCYIGEEGATCVSAADGQCGETCEASNDCAPGMLCVGDPPECRPICERGAACGGGADCIGLSGREDVGVCIPRQQCDVLEQDCAEGEGCYIIDDEQQCRQPAAEAGGPGDPCEFANSCQPGLLCSGTGDDEFQCLPLCSTDGMVECESGACAGLTDFEPIGVCVPEE